MTFLTVHQPIIASLTWGAVSGWWTPGCVLLALLYAWLMYRQPVTLNTTYRHVLAAARAIAVFLIAFLLISPLVSSVTYQPQKPLVLIAQDNSTSVKDFKPAGFNQQAFISQLAQLKQTLGSEYEVREFNFGQGLSDGLSESFTAKQTNISAAIRQLNGRFVNQNIGALVLATDGLYNQGNDPRYDAAGLKTNIYTIALGDTVPRRDLLIGNVNYNKTALLGNDFMIEVLAEAYQALGETMRLTVAEDGRTVSSQNIPINTNAWRRVMPVKLNAGKKGIHQYTIKITPVSNELSVQNNSETVYIEVLDARQKVLLLYNNAHPDIRVIRQSVERNKNYEFKAVQAADLASVKVSDYGLIILHQLTTPPVLREFLTRSRVSVWYMGGAQSDLSAFNSEQQVVQIASGRAEMQEVFALPVSGFSLFTLSDSAINKLSRMPPMLAPFGNYGTSANTTVLLKQKIGSVQTSYPLLAFSDADGHRTAVFSGEGLWRWQLAEYQTYGSHNAIDELISQSVQYLTANANRQRFRAYPAKTVFDEGEHIALNAELYNDALELVNTQDVKIVLKSSAGKTYNYLFSRSGKSYQLDAGILPVENYTYVATTRLGRDNFTASGKFTIRALNLENRQSTANRQLLYTMAKNSGGAMLKPSELDKLADMIHRNENIKTLVSNDTHYSDLIDIKWVFVLIVTLLGIEWFLRKREGEV